MSGYQIKVTIENTKPPVWRRLEIPDRITFRSLHDILQEAFGWQEMHLHGFTFQNTRVTVGDDGSYDYDENVLLADDFLRAGWIRYIYDYGDDWRHKIVLEKELPDYKQRYARVVKFKGDNFVEDSSGIWGDPESKEDGRIPYNSAEVNERLNSLVCPEHPSASTAEDHGIRVNEKKEEKEKRDRVMGMLDDFGQLLREAWQLGERAPIDLLEQETGEVWDDLAEQQNWKVRGSQKLIADILQADGIRHLSELHKYFGISEKEQLPLTKNMTEELAAALKEHPEYLTYMFEASELSQYTEWFRKRQAAQLPEHHILMGFAMLGLAELKLGRKKGKPYLYIELPQDAESIVAFLETQKLEELVRQVNRVWERIHGMVMCYGYIEIQALYEQFTRLFGEISQGDFERCLYLGGSFRGQIVTGVKRNETEHGTEHEPWVAVSAYTAEIVTESWAEHVGEGVGYKNFTRKQVLEMIRLGYAAVYPQWNILYDSLLHIFLEEWEAERLLNIWYDQILNGEGMRDLLLEIEEEKELVSPENWTILEHALCRCWSETGIPLLKGYSRKEIAELTGQNLFAVASGDGYELPGYADKNQGEAAAALACQRESKIEQEIKPDAFCPCGSGKRYRQCCGRKK